MHRRADYEGKGVLVASECGRSMSARALGAGVRGMGTKVVVYPAYRVSTYGIGGGRFQV
jgi:hypothetical protein